MQKIGGGIGSEIADEWADIEWFEDSYSVDSVISGTGAGDTAIAGFITALLEGETWEDCLHLAAAAGAMCVGTYDALSGMVPLSCTKERINAGWKKTDRKRVWSVLLVNLNEVLMQAKKEKYAIGLFNAVNLELGAGNY